jgi:choline dehydrogenase
MLSGVGPAGALRSLGIPVVADAAEVGGNLQDHLDFCTLTKCTRPVTYDFSAWQEMLVGLRYLLTHSGPGVSNIAEAGGFARSPLAADERPDLQLHFVPAQLDDHGRNRLPGHGFTVHACVLRPSSRGRITLRSSRPDDTPSSPRRHPAVARDHRLAAVRAFSRAGDLPGRGCADAAGAG